MKTITLVGLVVLGLLSSARAETLKVSSLSLSGWVVAGGQPLPAASPEALVLAPGGRISRIFETSEISVQLVTQPVFATEPANWPVIEIGGAALGFIKRGHEGRAVLLVDQGEPLELDHTFMVDATGRAATPLKLEFTRRGKTVTVTCAGAAINTPAESPITVAEVVVSSGANQPWVISQFTVQVPDGVALDAQTRLRDTDSNAGSGLARGAAVGTASSASQETGSAPGDKKTSAPAKPAEAPARALEVMTPPSVRPVRSQIENKLSENHK